MNIEELQQICGAMPENFEKAVVEGTSYIFQQDPNFVPINVYDFFGRVATVNSFKECFYYVELGFKPDRFTIFDLLSVSIYVFAVIFLIFILSRPKVKNLTNEYISYIKKSKFYKKSKRNILNTRFLNSAVFLFVLIQSYFIFNIISFKSLRIKRFIDEYNVLSSSVQFFNNLDFNAGGYLGGNYTVQLTSGPLSAIGGVIGWNITNSFNFSRVSNFLWVILLQLFLSYFVIKSFKLDFRFILLTTGSIMLLVPWWQGALYSLGEIPSTIIFINSLFLFSKYRKSAIILFSFSIFFTKLIILVPFAAFYIVIILYEKSIKKIMNDFSLFLIPLILWLLIVYFKYDEGTLYDYIISQIKFVTEHKSSGIASDINGRFSNYIYNLNNTEFLSWSIYRKIRVIFTPLIFSYLVYKNRKNIDERLGIISLPLISSTLSIYLWFWVLNSTKWIRYSQHFTLLLIISIIYFVSSNIRFTKVDSILIYSTIVIFLDEIKHLIILLMIVGAFLIILTHKKHSALFLKLFLLIVLTLNIYIPHDSSLVIDRLFNKIDNCVELITNQDCRIQYLSQ